MGDNRPKTPERPDIYAIPFRQRFGGRTPAHTQRIVIILLVVISALAAGALLLFGPLDVMAIPLIIVTGIAIMAYPMVGLVLYVILSFVRPADFYPALNAIPLAKAIGGVTLVAVFLKHMLTKDLIFNARQTYLLLAFAGALVLSIPLSFWPSHSIDVTEDFLKIIIFYFTFINIVRDYRSLRRISLVAVIGTLFLGLFIIRSFLAGELRAGVAESNMFDANDVAQLLVTALPFCLFWNSGPVKTPLGRLMMWGTMAFLTVTAIMTTSRGALLGLFVVYFVLFSGRQSLLTKIIKFTAIAAFGFLLMTILPSQMSNRFRTIETYQQDESAMHRLYAWKAGLHMLAARPLTGVGAGCFGVAYGTAFRPGGESDTRWMAPHNSIVQVAAETGVVGLTMFMAMIIYSLRKINGVISGDKRLDDVSRIYTASFLGFLTCAMFLTQAMNFMLYFLVAASVTIARLESVRVADETSKGHQLLPPLQKPSAG
jgi:putative inorganic carbon (hco3(-)) transporter